MTIELFIVAFLILAILDWWMNMVQRTTQLICRANNAPLDPVGGLLNPRFIRVAFPITLSKWTLVFFWAWYSSVTEALVALAVAWVVSVISPIPFGLTLPSVLRQIARVSEIDAPLGHQLLRMVETWKTVGARH